MKKLPYLMMLGLVLSLISCKRIVTKNGVYEFTPLMTVNAKAAPLGKDSATHIKASEQALWLLSQSKAESQLSQVILPESKPMLVPESQAILPHLSESQPVHHQSPESLPKLSSPVVAETQPVLKQALKPTPKPTLKPTPKPTPKATPKPTPKAETQPKSPSAW